MTHGRRRLAVIMFTDMVGYSSHVHADEAEALALVDAQGQLIRSAVDTHGGRVIKSTGDGVLAEFSSALSAIECAVDLQRRVHERNRRSGGTEMRLRVGLHLGDVERRGTDILGDAVNVAARIEGVAEPGGVCLSGQLYEQVRARVPFAFEGLGPRALEGQDAPIELYRVRLPWLGPSEREEPTSARRIAVLPLANISPDPKDEYFADGLTEELIAVLSTLPGLRVIARTSVAQYKTASKTIAQIGSELNVGSILEGSVRKVGERIRITMQLIDVASQEPAWAESYNRNLDDVFAIQADIAERTSGALRLRLLGSGRPTFERRPTENLAAYDLYLRGIHAAHRSAMGGASEAIDCFERATRLDPRFSLAYSHWANGLILLAGDKIAPEPAFARARELVARALELDPESSDATAVRANLTLQTEGDWTRAEEEFRKALVLNPSDPNVHNWYGLLLMTLQRFEEAKEQFRSAAELDPLWPLPRCWLIEIHERLGEYSRAAGMAEEALAKGLEQRPWLHALLGIACAQLGRGEEAEREAEASAGGSVEPEWLSRAALLARLGRLPEVRQMAQEREAAAEREYVPAAMVAGLWASSGEDGKAIGWLERDLGSQERGLWFDYLSPCFDPLRGNARFDSLLREANLPSSVGWTLLLRTEGRIGVARPDGPT